MAPKMMFASGWAASATRFAASLTSHSDMSRPPVMDSRIERAPSTEVSSSGDATARSAASTARCSPTPMPMPSSAVPASDMIVRTSAKSRLISPGKVIRSEMPCTPWRSTSSAMRNASTIDTRLSSTVNRRELAERLDLVVLLESRLSPELGVRARAEPARDLAADVQRHVGARLLQRLHVGVDGDEVDALDAGLDHPVHRVHAGAADADDAKH